MLPVFRTSLSVSYISLGAFLRAGSVKFSNKKCRLLRFARLRAKILKSQLNIGITGIKRSTITINSK